jgi:DNA repair protein RadD
VKGITLRDWQAEAQEKVREAIRQGAKNILVVAPTGGGKTIWAAHTINAAVEKGNRAAFVVDRINLVNQTSEVFSSFGLDHGVIQSTHVMYAPHKRIQVCSAQTLARRAWPDAQLIVIDEAHTISETAKKRLSQRNSIAIGLTATPFTKGLGKLYDAVVNVTTTNRLIEDGILAKYRIFAAQEPDMTGVKVVAGEWEEKETAKRALQVVGHCVTEYVKHGQGKKFICSAVNTAHVEELHRQFMQAGIHCAAYTYKVSDGEREEIVKEFRKPDSYIRGLITVTAATKGFDVPDVGVVIMARPLRKSLAEHIQFFGRGLRAHADKEHCIVLDHSGNCTRFWKEWNQFFESGAVDLDSGEKKKAAQKPDNDDDSISMIKCPSCKHLHQAQPFCPNCGHEYPKRSQVVHVAGQLKEIGGKVTGIDYEKDLWPQIVDYAHLQRGPGDPGRKLALALYKNLTGQWPKGKFETTQRKTITAPVYGQIKRSMIAYQRSRAKQQRYA